MDRLNRIAQELGVVPDKLTTLTPQNVPSFMVPDDERRADAILGQLKIESKSRRFSKSPTYDELYGALSWVVSENGMAGVVEVLIKRFGAVEGNINLARKASIGMIRRVKSTEQRGQLIQSATEIGRDDFVQLFAPLADQPSLDQALNIALENRNLSIIETLLRYGANSALHEETFINAAREDAELLKLLLRARLRVPGECITQCLLPEAPLDVALALLQAGADGGSVLMQVVEMDRIDLVAAIILAPKPPSAAGLDAALNSVVSSTSFNKRYSLIEILLCGRPVGNAASEALFKATLLANVGMMQLLLAHKVDINHNGASAVAHAIQRNRGDLVGLLLQNQSLKPDLASELVRHIPRASQPTDKIGILSKLLVNGASGTYCNELLITAAEQNDLDTAQLLICYGRDQNNPVCSVNYNASKCLQVAVSRNNVSMVKLLALEGSPSKFSLATAFSSIPPNLNKNDHFLMVQTLLRGGAHGPEVNEALHAAVTRHKSPRLVKMLVHFGAVVTSGTLFACVSQGSVDLLDVLIARISPRTCAQAIAIAMKHSGATRYRMIKVLLGPSAGLDVPEISSAVVDILQNCPEDIKLLALLCRDGKANVNFKNGLAVVLALKQADPVVLDIVLRGEGTVPTSETIEQGLRCAIDLPLTDANRRIKIAALLWRVKPQNAMNQALVKEIRYALTTKDLAVLGVLLDAGADVNSYGAAPVCLAIGEPSILDLILFKRPSQKSLSIALPSAINLQGARLSACEKLLKAGATGIEVNEGLLAAAKEGPDSLPLVKLLLPYADVNFMEGQVFRFVVREGFTETLELLLAPPSMPTIATKACAFQEAMELKETKDRLRIVQRLLAAGIPTEAVSDALITAVNLDDLALVEHLLKSDASVDHMNGLAIHSAASFGQDQILKLLVERKPSLSTLTTGFGGAVVIQEPEKYRLVLDTLLQAGLRGEAVDAALVEAVKAGDLSVVELLFKNGASIEWRDGEALAIATQTAAIETLTSILERPAPQHVLARAWMIAVKLTKDRCPVIELLLKAGKVLDDHVSKALTAATKQNPSDRKLIKILLESGAFDCGESMIHAATVLDLRTLTMLADSPKAADFISSAFKEAMSTGILWQSATGLAIVELMLKKGASGDAVAEGLYQAVDRSQLGTILASDFLEVFLRYGADSNYQRGLVLQRAALEADVGLIERLLPTANVESKAMAMPYLFTSGEPNVQQALEAFSSSIEGVDKDEIVVFNHPDADLEPILFQALSQFPRDTYILRILLDMGYNPNQWQMLDEPWPILCWALDQPEKKISSANIEMLIDGGANVNFRSRSGITPLTLAIRNQRSDIVLKLLSKGANVTDPNAEGITPLNLAGSLTNTDIMGYILQAGAETDDGSLHDVSRQLRCDAMRTLIKNGHEVDYPSDRHEGRSALAELCLRAMDHSPPPAKLEDAIQCLIVNDANIREVSYSGKTIFHYALDSIDPLTILAVLLKMMWKFVNEDAFLFTDKKYTYSLTKYVEKGLFAGPEHQKHEILRLLRNKRAKDRFWAHSIDEDQPEDYCNAPPHIEAEVRLQKARRKRQAEQREDVQKHLELKRLTVIGEVEIMNITTEAEISRDRHRGRVERELLSEKANTQLQLDLAADVSKDKMLAQKYLREEGHKRQLRDIQVSTQRAIMAEESEKERARSVMQIEFMEKRVELENNAARNRLAIEGSAFHEQDKVLLKQHERELARIKMQKGLVERQTTLAGTFQGAGLNQRQIGYITEA